MSGEECRKSFNGMFSTLSFERRFLTNDAYLEKVFAVPADASSCVHFSLLGRDLIHNIFICIWNDKQIFTIEATDYIFNAIIYESCENDFC